MTEMGHSTAKFKNQRVIRGSRTIPINPTLITGNRLCSNRDPFDFAQNNLLDTSGQTLHAEIVERVHLHRLQDVGTEPRLLNESEHRAPSKPG